MTLRKQQNEELDSLKQQIEAIENLIDKCKCELVWARSIENDKKVCELEKSIHYAYAKINKSVSIQAESMKLPYDLVIDLIFDREYTLKNLII